MEEDKEVEGRGGREGGYRNREEEEEVEENKN